MKVCWTKGLSPEKKEEVRSDFQASGALRERLASILQEKIDASRKASILKDSYESPNWAYLQADINGFVRALEEIQSILK